MARSINEILNYSISQLVAYAATLGITINPNDWIYTPGIISETDYKLLLLHTIAAGQGFEEQLNDLFQAQQEKLISSAAPQIGLWFQQQMLNFQWDPSSPQVPVVQLSSPPSSLSVIWSPEIVSDRVISFCSATFGSAGRCLIKVAAESGGIPVDLDTSTGVGALAAATSFVNMIAGAGISYVVTSGKSDWLFLQLDVWYNGLYSSVIFANIQTAITNFLNSLSVTALGQNSLAVVKLSALEEAILNVTGVNDVEFVNVAARPDLAFPTSPDNTFGTSNQVFLVLSNTENYRLWQTIAGYIALENGTSSGTPLPTNTLLSDFRVGSSGLKNLNLISE